MRLRPPPVLFPELERRWAARAAQLGLHPGDEGDLRTAAFRALGREVGPFRPNEIERVLAEAEASARRRRPAFRLDLDGARLVIEADPEGRVDILPGALGPALAALRRAARAERDRHLAHEARRRRAAGLTLAEAARGLAVSRATLVRSLRRARLTEPPDLSLGAARSGPILEAKAEYKESA